MSDSDKRKAPEEANPSPEKKTRTETKEDTGVDSKEEVLKVIERHYQSLSSDDTATKSDDDNEKNNVDHTDSIVVLDVRTETEILSGGFLQPSKPGYRWLHVSCSREAGPLLEATAPYMIPNKNTPIIAYCRSGARSGRAKVILKAQGYKTVVNAGGFADLEWLQTKLAAEQSQKANN